MSTFAVDFDLPFIFEQEVTIKKYPCDVVGCNKSYSKRQNRHRHKLKDHPNSMNSKVTSKYPQEQSQLILFNEVNLQHEREMLIETFSSLCEQIGEDQAFLAMKNNKKLKEHLIPLRKILEADTAQHLYDAHESQSQVERQLVDFRNAMPEGPSDEMATFKAVISLVKNSTPESIEHIQLFSKALSSLTEHITTYSEKVNPKLKQSRALKNLLDQMFANAVDELGLPVTPPNNSSGLKRRANGNTDNDMADLSDPLQGSDAKKSRSSIGQFIANFLSTGDKVDGDLNH